MAKAKTRSGVNPKKGSSSAKKNAQKKKVEPATQKTLKEAEDSIKSNEQDREKNAGNGFDISEEFVTKAVEELKKFVDREQNTKESSKLQLFDDEDEEERNLYLQVINKKYFLKKPQFKPRLLKISNSLYDLADTKTCLVLRDQLVSKEEQVEALEEAKLPTLTKILPLKTLKAEFKPYEKRRQLYLDYDLFLVDDALLNLMPTLLGKIFYSNKSSKVPIPIRVTSATKPKELSLETLKNQLEKSLASTAYLPPIGVSVSVKVGMLNNNFSVKQLAANILDSMAFFDKESSRAILLKSSSSPSLPLFYTEKLYSDEDLIHDNETVDKKDDTGVRLTAFEKGLLDLGDTEIVSKIIGKKLKNVESTV